MAKLRAAHARDVAAAEEAIAQAAAPTSVTADGDGHQLQQCDAPRQAQRATADPDGKSDYEKNGSSTQRN